MVLGAGIFGLTAAIELRHRGYQVTMADPGPVPHPVAASNDVSRMVRMDYGADGFYTELCAKAIDGWHSWNRRWGKDLYHEDGFLLMSSVAMAAGSFEQDSYSLLTGQGLPLERLKPGQLTNKYPRWSTDYYICLLYTSPSPRD